MTKKEVVQLLEEIDAAYPSKLKKTKETVEVWHRNMKDQEAKRVMYLLDNHISKSPFVPTIHDLKDQARPCHDKGLANRILSENENTRSYSPENWQGMREGILQKWGSS